MNLSFPLLTQRVVFKKKYYVLPGNNSEGVNKSSTPAPTRTPTSVLYPTPSQGQGSTVGSPSCPCPVIIPGHSQRLRKTPWDCTAALGGQAAAGDTGSSLHFVRDRGALCSRCKLVFRLWFPEAPILLVILLVHLIGQCLALGRCQNTYLTFPLPLNSDKEVGTGGARRREDSSERSQHQLNPCLTPHNKVTLRYLWIREISISLFLHQVGKV